MHWLASPTINLFWRHWSRVEHRSKSQLSIQFCSCSTICTTSTTQRITNNMRVPVKSLDSWLSRNSEDQALVCRPRNSQPTHIPLPSREPGDEATLHHTSHLQVQFMVQVQQFRKCNKDEHYAVALFRYFCEFAVRFKGVCQMVSLDDKHRMKIGEPGFPVAVVERGQIVLVKVGSSFEVGDSWLYNIQHDTLYCTS